MQPSPYQRGDPKSGTGWCPAEGTCLGTALALPESSSLCPCATSTGEGAVTAPKGQGQSRGVVGGTAPPSH